MPFSKAWWQPRQMVQSYYGKVKSCSAPRFSGGSYRTSKLSKKGTARALSPGNPGENRTPCEKHWTDGLDSLFILKRIIIRYMTEKIKMLAIVERGKGKGNFSCFTPGSVEKCGFGGGGSSARAVMEDTYLSLQEEKEEWAKEGKEFPDVEFDFRFDVGSFFDYYPIDVTAFAKYIGMNPSTLRLYVAGIREPKEESIKKIREGIYKLSEDLGMNLMVEKPPVSYVL